MSAPALITAEDLAPLSAAPPGERIAYGTDPLQFGELTLPSGAGPHPVIVNVHGGVWLAAYGLDHSRAEARAFADSGFAVWNLEYRRVGNPGGGWPGTFADVALGLDSLRMLARRHALDLARICVVGHSAGGQLAMWLGARARIAVRSELYRADPLSVRGVLALAPACELPQLCARGLFDGIAARLLGGTPAQVPQRYAAVTPALLGPSTVPQLILVGEHDSDWIWHSADYFEEVKRAGDTLTERIVLPDAGHFELIAPHTRAFAQVLAAAHRLVG